MSQRLPPGQTRSETFPRFGLSQFARRFPSQTDRVEIAVGGDVEVSTMIKGQDLRLERITQVSDFHCVTTWSKLAVEWSGFRFSDVYEKLIVPLARPAARATSVVFRCQDGYRARLPLEDPLVADVLLADTLDGKALTVAHGAPMRLIAPRHYGYKSVKHLKAIEFQLTDAPYRTSGLSFMEHPRARVKKEERGSYVPGWLLRHLYRPLIKSTARKFEAALEAHLARTY